MALTIISIKLGGVVHGPPFIPTYPLFQILQGSPENLSRYNRAKFEVNAGMTRSFEKFDGRSHFKMIFFGSQEGALYKALSTQFGEAALILAKKNWTLVQVKYKIL